MMDKELKAMAAIQRTLYGLLPGERQRVLAWMDAKAAEGSWHNDAPVPKEPAAAPPPVAVEPEPAPAVN